MKTGTVLIVLSLLLSILLAGPSFGQDAPLMMYRDARAMGMGNAFEAITSDTSALHYNPAGLARAEKTKFEFLLFRARISYDLASELKETNDLIDNIRDIVASDDPLKDKSLESQRRYVVDRLEEMLTERLGMLGETPGLALVVPTRMGRMTLSLAGAIYTQGRFSMYIERRGIRWSDPIKDMLDNYIIYDLSAQLNYQLAWAVGLPLGPTKLYAGMSFRKINRHVFTDMGDPMTVEDMLNPDGPDGIPGTEDDFQKRFFNYEEEDRVKLIRESFKSAPGYTMDFGLASELMDGLSVAMAIRNLAGNIRYPDGDRNIPRNTVISASIQPMKLLKMKSRLLDLTLSASYDNPNGDDALGDFKNDALSDHVHLGAEAILFPGSSLSIGARWGNNQGYLTSGLTLKLGGLYIDAARYGDLEADWHVLSVKLAF
ncbi:TPA: hypothetical protein ENG04_01640 [Candidatus Poribacteria bacterium]|nr:hypothetical protein [Candidatus Poribacteria bacterium]HEX28764.1 hypothetical protein [Candidatus Poribacteria bacterium]